MLFPTLGLSSLPVMVAQPDERHANRTASVLEWYDRYGEHTTSSSKKNFYIMESKAIRVTHPTNKHQ